MKDAVTVDIKVGSFIRHWVVEYTGSDIVSLDETSNIWGIIRSNLELLPKDYKLIEDRSEYISIELLDCHSTEYYNRPSADALHMNTLYRCYINPTAQAVIRRWFENQFRNAFRLYMVGRYSDDKSQEPIRHAIGSFLVNYDLPMDSRMINRLSKDWYRFRQKHGDKFPIPIFF